MSINLSGRALKRLRLPVVNYYSSAYQVMSAQAGDVNTRYLDVVLYDDRGDIDLGAYSKVYLQVQAYDGISPQMSEGWIDTERNRAVCRLTSSMLQYTGSKMPCNIWLVGTDADDEPMSLTSQTFYVMVYEGHGGIDAEPSEDELTALQSAINDVVELEKTVGEAEANRQENFRSVYIKYSFDANGYNYTDSWQQGQQYMGVANTTEEPENAAGYSWILISGGSSGGSAVTVVGKNGYGFYRLAGEHTADTTNVATEDIQRRADREVQSGDMLITPEGLIFVLDEYDADNDTQKVSYYTDIGGGDVSEEAIAAAVEMYMSENEIDGSGADDIDIVDEDGSYKLILTKDGEHIGSGVNMPTYTAEDVGAAEKDHNHDEKYQPRGNYAAEGHNHDDKYQPAGNYLTDESDPTVPSWAKQPTKPTYTADEVNARPNTWMPTAEDVGARPSTWTPTASDVGADAIDTAATKVTDHNADTDSHNDIRLLIQGLDARLTALADSDDTTLDQLSELVAYIKANRGLIESITTNKVNVDAIINNLTTNDAEKPLSAAQGVALKALIDNLTTTVNGKQTAEQVATAISNALKAYPTTTAMQTAISTALADYAKADHNHDGTYAKPADIPTKLSQLAGDSTHRTVTDTEKTVWNGKAAGGHDHDGVYVKQTGLNDAVNTALQTAKDSGEFDGDPGKDGEDGETPYIGANGNWWIGNNDTGTIANGMTQVTPLNAESVEWLEANGEQGKLYVLSDKSDPEYGFIYHYAEVEVEVEVDGGGCTNVLDTYTPTINKRWSHSENSLKPADGYVVVGPVPVKPEDEVRVNVKYYAGHQFFSANYCRVHYFDASGDYVAGTYDRAIYRDEKLIVEGETTKWVVGYANATDNKPDTNTKLEGYDDIVSMVCVFCVNGGGAITEADVADLVMTINEPIVEGGGGPTTEIQKVWQWTNTGHAFIPADYEGRIKDVEERAASNTTRIIALEKGGKTGATTKEQAWENLKTWRKPVFEDAPVFLLNSDKPAITNIEGADKGLYAKYNTLQMDHPDYISEPEELCTGSDGVTPIYAYRFCEPSALYHSGFTMVEDKPTIIIVSGVHPSEVAGSHSVYHAMEEITTNPELADLRRNVEFIVVPMINPTASSDLHYDFEVDHNPSKTAEPYTMVESEALADIINRHQSTLALVMSCHSNDIDTYFGQCIGWVSSGDYFTSIVGTRLADKLSKAWVEKYEDKLPAGLAEANAYVKTATTTGGALRWPQAVTLPVTDQRMVKVCMSNSGGTEYKQAHKVGAFGVNVEGCARCIPLDRNAAGEIDYSVSCTANVTTTGCELYVNYLRTFLSAWSRLDKSEYAHDLPWVE